MKLLACGQELTLLKLVPRPILLSSWAKEKQRKSKILQVVFMGKIELDLLCIGIDVGKENMDLGF